MYKSLFSLILVLSLLTLCPLTGCSNEEDIADQTETTKTTEANKVPSNDDGILNLLMVGSSYCYYYV